MSKAKGRRVKTPTMLQMEAVECGAASLGMVLGYYGRRVPLEDLRYECGVSRDGSNAGSLLKAARNYGMETKGFRKPWEAVKEAPLPCIIFWNFNHFLVVEGHGNGRFYLNDPASGPRWVTEAEFAQQFSGVLLTFQPGPDFKPGGPTPSVIRGLQQRLAGTHRALLFVALVSLALVVPGLIIPAFSRIFVDDVLLGGMSQRFGPLLLGMALTAVLRGGLTWLQQYYLLRMETKIALSNASRFFWHVLRLPMQFFNQRHGGEVGHRVGLNDRVAQLLSGRLATAMLNLGTILFFLVLMFRYSTLLTAIAIGAALLNLACLQWVARMRVDQSRRLLQDESKVITTAMAGLQSMETLKATGSESDFFAKWSGYHARLVHSQQTMGLSTQYLGAVPSLLQTLSNVAVLGIGGIQVMNGDLTIGMLVAFQSLMMSFMHPVNDLVSMGSELHEVEGVINRLDDILNYDVDASIAAEALAASLAGTRPAKLTGQVEFRNVTFSYDRLRPPLIQDFNLILRPGTRVALVGGSGSGKSTISKLLTGLYQPWSGEILFDGETRQQVPREVLTLSLASVDQDIRMFEGTVGENLTLWDTTIPKEHVVQAARDACIHDEISARPGGYEYSLSEGGRNFSGGQRQRLEIARALVGNPTILVLDEATSALDVHTERLVDQHLRKRGCTCVIVAHRLSTIRDCDEIIVLDQGKVVERGTHDELRDRGGRYANLIAEH